MYHFLVQTLIGLEETQRSRVKNPALARNLLVHLQNGTMSSLSVFLVLETLLRKIFIASKGPRIQFIYTLQQTTN